MIILFSVFFYLFIYLFWITPSVSSISRVLRARFGKKDDEDDCDKKDESGEKKTKHSIDGILGDKGNSFLLYFNLVQKNSWVLVQINVALEFIWGLFCTLNRCMLFVSVLGVLAISLLVELPFSYLM